MGLFSKETCIICNSDTGALNKFKLNDGHFLCGNCVTKANICDGFNANVLKSSSIDEIKKRIVDVENDLKANSERISKFKATTQVGNLIWFDDNNKWFVFPKGTFSAKIENSYVFNYNEILDFEILEDGSSITKGGLGKALIGGAVFGLAGAIAGGSSKKAKQTCTNLQFKVITKNTDRPVIYLPLITSETKKDSFIYKQLYKSVQDMLSKFQIIMDEIEREQNISKEANTNSVSSVADEIKKFKELLDMGAISQEEFNAKKKELLG